MNHFAGDAGGVVDAGALGSVGATLDGVDVEGVAAGGRAVLGDDFGALAGGMDAGGVNDRGDVALGRGFGRALLVGDRDALGVGRSWMELGPDCGAMDAGPCDAGARTPGGWEGLALLKRLRLLEPGPEGGGSDGRAVSCPAMKKAQARAK